jgi:uncharacterized cupredoxin-like copper-binding protein
MRVGAALIAVVLGALAAGAAAGAPAGEAATTVKVVLKEWKLTSWAGHVASGKNVTFVVRNTGKRAHEFVVVRTRLKPEALPIIGGRASQVGAQGRIALIRSGETRRLTVSLEDGSYVLLCNRPGHYKAGMFAGLHVGMRS